MDIDAVVKEPIVAGVKGLKVVVGSVLGCWCVTLCADYNVLQMEGRMRVILEPLIGDAPLVGGVTFFFIRRPVSASHVFFTSITQKLSVATKFLRVKIS